MNVSLSGDQFAQQVADESGHDGAYVNLIVTSSEKRLK